MMKYVTVKGRKRKRSDSNEERVEKLEEKVNKKEKMESGDDEGRNDNSEVGAGSVVGCKLQYTMKKGDLFSCPADYSLAHCISADVRLGKGIATLFRNKFGGIDDLKKQGAKTGGLAFLKRGDRYIYNLVTKDKYWQKPTYKTLQSSLTAMKVHCQKNQVTQLAMPMIGCGLDGLEWNKVEKIIKDVFSDCDMTITVYRL